MAKDDIEPTSLTLRFKHGKNTILLFAEPLSPFSTIKTDLLVTLKERYPEGLPPPPPKRPSDSTANIPIPESVIDVVLGVPVDVFDSTRGWTEIDTRGGAAIRESPRSLGLKDGGMVAFVFTDEKDEGDPEFWVEFSDENELYPQEE